MSADETLSMNVSDGLRVRQVSLDVLNAVLERKQTLDQVLERGSDFKGLPVQDKRFCRMLVATVLRRLGQIDDLIAKAEDRSVSRTVSLQNILRIGIAQIMFMNVPDHAALDTTVELAARRGMSRQKSFVNGLLRTMTRVGREWLERQDEARLNTPEWILKIWIADYGLRTAAEIASANLAEAPLDISIRDEQERSYWSNAFKATEIGAGTLRKVSGGQVTDMEGFDRGAWWVQDASAALPVNVLGDVSGKTVVDLCAAPGGKTMQLAARGARVIALDRSAQRLKRLHENMDRIGLANRVETIVSDAAVWQPLSAPEFILLDAPCTATGTMRRNPDVAHLKSPQDLERLAGVQARLLLHAFDILAPSGTLVYCTCSLQKAEGEQQIEHLINVRSDSYKVPIKAEDIGDLKEPVTEEGYVRVLPFHQAALGGMDGFFIGKIRKIK